MSTKFFRTTTLLAIICLWSVTTAFAADGEKSGFHGWGDSQRTTSSADGAQQQPEKIKEPPPEAAAEEAETLQPSQTASAGEEASPRAELREKIQREREAFFKDTKKLRQEIYQKRLELRSELAKSDPSARRAKSIQKDIASQRAELDRMRLEHFLKLKKIDPQMGFREKQGREGYGSCPNCPYQNRGYRGGGQMMGPGYGDRYHMMGPGNDYRHHMMGPGFGRHHMWDDDDDWQTRPERDKQEWSQGRPSQKSPKAAAELSESDARAIVSDYLKSTRNPNLKIGQVTDAGSAFQAEIVTKDGSLVDKLLVDKNSGYMRPAY